MSRREQRTDEPIPVEQPPRAECPWCGDEEIAGNCTRQCPASRRAKEKRVDRTDGGKR